MAKLGSFFRRLFTSFNTDVDCPSATTTTTSSSSITYCQKNVIIIPPLTPPLISKPTISYVNLHPSRSCSTSPRPQYRVITKQKTLHIDRNNNGNSKSNFLSSNTTKSTNRRLSAPLIIHASTHLHQKHRSAIVDQNMEEALIFPLQRLSLTSTTGTSVHHHHHNNSVNSLGTSAGSPCPSPRFDVHSSSLNLSPSNSINMPSSFNNISPASGTPPSQFVVGPSTTSSRVSIPSNNSTSPNTDRRMSLQMRGRRPSMFDPIDPKELQQALYASAAAKATISTNPTTEDDLTRALSHITISYDRDSGHVSIDTLAFENLHMLDGYINNNNGDLISFYCRFRLLPEKRSLFQTKIVRLTRLQSSYLFDKKQLNEFELSYDQLNNHSIEIFLYKISTMKPLYKDIRLATIKYDLNELSQSDQCRMKKSFDECDPSTIVQDPDLGELLISLSYLQSAAKLSVVILGAKNLRPLTIETKSYPDVCVKVTLYDRNRKKIKRKKTSVQRTSDCPTFNEELVFELRRDIASEVTIEVRLVHESLSYKEQLGSVIFGPIVNNMIKGLICAENVYWSTVLSGESLNAQWQILKPSIKIDESK
ncbi:unnamed protein product [Adineta steineri]|uniref:C2 domain-containing protein n=1 Tax=Adineta steineri TaxID=433720 RepID=A0A815DHT8_9BILA|nr:unnamed protein product [Adineta steineri]